MPANESVPDAFCSVDDLLVDRAYNDTGDPIIGYPHSETTNSDFLLLSAKEIHEYTNAAAWGLLKWGLRQVSIDEAEVIGLLGLSDLEYMITMFALSRLGYTVFLLSPRLTPEALTSLLKTMGCQTVFYASNLKASVEKISGLESFRALPLLKRDDYHRLNAVTPLPQVTGDRTPLKQKTAFIMHSSGSTGLPNPIFQTHQACLQNYANGYNLRAFLTLPLYHTHGHACLYRAIFKGNPIYLVNAKLPLTSGNLTEALESVSPEIIFTVPYVLGLLVDLERGIRAMKSCKIVSSAGSQIPDGLGDQIVDHGIHLITFWGSTETGALMDSMRPYEDKDWAYMSLFPFAKPFVQMMAIGADNYELVALDGLKSKNASNSDDPLNSYHSRDMFEAHPTKAGRWKYVGRMDDRVTLTNGEKVLPIVMEGLLRRDPLIGEAVVFGIGRDLPGLLLFRGASAAALSDNDFIEKVWPVVETANNHVESFARVSKELILPIGAEVDYPQTDKGTIIRLQVYKMFAELINNAYENFERGSNSELTVLSLADMERLILQSFESESSISLPSIHTDFFSAGIDSLQAIKMAGHLKRKLCLPASADLKANTVFEQATAERLARYLISLQTEGQIVTEDDSKTMQSMINRYSVFTKFVPTRGAPLPSSVLLTGVTGSLGVNLLIILLHESNIDKIYCLVRASSLVDAKSRILSALMSREIPLTKGSEKRVIALPCSLDREDLGLEPSTLSELKKNVSLIIHNAWAVNFGLSLSSFEDQHIKGTHNLLRFALSVEALQPAQFVFVSSVSVASRMKKSNVSAEALLEDLDSAMPGYGQSKLVGEHLVNNAAIATGFDSCVIRIGQIAGDSQSGIWNDSESVPLVIRSALTLGCLPQLEESCSWIPVDVVAKILVELGRAGSLRKHEAKDDGSLTTPCRFYNVVNPKPFSWTASLLPALRAAGLPFEAVLPRTWLARLASGDQDPISNPTIKLKSFYESRYSTNADLKVLGNGTSRQEAHVDATQTDHHEQPSRDSDSNKWRTEKAQQQSSTMRNLPDLIREGYIKKFLARWLEKWQAEHLLAAKASID